MLQENDALAKAKVQLEHDVEQIGHNLKTAQVDCAYNTMSHSTVAPADASVSLVGQDQKAQIEGEFSSVPRCVGCSCVAIRLSVADENRESTLKVAALKEEITALKDKDRLNLEEIKRLLVEKVDLQSTGITQREKALQREHEFG